MGNFFPGKFIAYIYIITQSKKTNFNVIGIVFILLNCNKLQCVRTADYPGELQGFVRALTSNRDEFYRHVCLFTQLKYRFLGYLTS